MCVSSRTAQAEEPSEQGEGGDDEDQAWFVCPFRVCSEVASKAARRDVEEQAASAQTTDLVEDATKASELAVGMRFCSWTIADCGLCLLVQDEQLQENKQAPAKPRKQTCSANTPWQDLAAARRARDRAENAVVRADQAVTGLGDVVAALQRQWLQEYNANNSEKADEIETKIDEIEAKREKAKKELAEAKKELAEAEYNAKASVQAGRGQAGGLLRVQLLLLTLVCSTPACVFVRSTVVAFWGHALLSARVISSLSFTVLACSPSGSGRGSWLLQEIWLHLVSLPMLRTGCQS